MSIITNTTTASVLSWSVVLGVLLIEIIYLQGFITGLKSAILWMVGGYFLADIQIAIAHFEIDNFKPNDNGYKHHLIVAKYGFKYEKLIEHRDDDKKTNNGTSSVDDLHLPSAGKTRCSPSASRGSCILVGQQNAHVLQQSTSSTVSKLGIVFRHNSSDSKTMGNEPMSSMEITCSPSPGSIQFCAPGDNGCSPCAPCSPCCPSKNNNIWWPISWAMTKFGGIETTEIDTSPPQSTCPSTEECSFLCAPNCSPCAPSRNSNFWWPIMWARTKFGGIETMETDTSIPETICPPTEECSLLCAPGDNGCSPCVPCSPCAPTKKGNFWWSILWAMTIFGGIDTLKTDTNTPQSTCSPTQECSFLCAPGMEGCHPCSPCQPCCPSEKTANSVEQSWWLVRKLSVAIQSSLRTVRLEENKHHTTSYNVFFDHWSILICSLPFVCNHLGLPIAMAVIFPIVSIMNAISGSGSPDYYAHHSERAPSYVVLAQKFHLLMTPKDHESHHRNPRTGYAYFSPITNIVLDNSGFWTGVRLAMEWQKNVKAVPVPIPLIDDEK